MNGLVVSAIVIMGFIVVYVFLIQIYSVLFRITGMTKSKSKFQVISLLTNSGYTTTESEIVTDDQTRRKIATAAMLTGYVFSVIIVSLTINLVTNIVNEVKSETTDIWALINMAIVFGMFILVIIFFKIPPVKRAVEHSIESIASKFLSKGKNDNQILLIDNYGKEAVCEVLLQHMPEFMENKTLLETKIRDAYGINILMLNRKGRVLTITKDTVFQKGDRLVVFGPYKIITEVFSANYVVKTEEVISDVNEVSIIDNYGTDAMARIVLNDLPLFLEGKTLVENCLKDQYSINVMMIKRNGKVIEVKRDTVIMKNDDIIVFGPYINIKHLFIYNNN